MISDRRNITDLRMRAVRLLLCAALILLAAGMPLTARADDGHAHDSKAFTAWTDRSSMPAESGSFYLTHDVRLNAAWEVSGTVELCLNGHSITYAGSSASNVITVSEGGRLDLYDCSSRAGKIRGGTAGGIRVHGGGFNMYGGSVSDNSGGPGLYLEGRDGGFAMSNLSGGSVTSNTNRNGSGGGLLLENNIWVNMKEGFSVTGNEAKNGAGIYCGSRGYLSAQGCRIQDNYASADGGGIFASALGGASVSDGGLVTKNTAAGDGGGICVKSGGYAESENSFITDNTASGRGGGMYVYTGADSMGASRVYGGAVTGNKAYEKGGGIYYELEPGSDLLEFQVSAAAVIDQNTLAGSVRSNFHIAGESKITAYSGMSADARIGVTMETPGVFTKNYIHRFNTQDPRTVFFSDLSGYEIQASEDGKEAQLVSGDFRGITIAESEHGSVLSSDYTAAPGAVIKLTPLPEDGYWIDSWKVKGSGGSVEVSDNSFIMPAYDVTVSAVFTQDAYARAHVESVSLDRTRLSVREGGVEKLTETIRPESAVNRKVTWSSSNSKAATVSNDGTVTAVSEGSAVITVTTEDGGKTASCEVTVLPPQFTVTFTDGRGKTLATRKVERGQAAEAPQDPVLEGASFDRWDRDFSNITEDLTVNAVWKSNNAIDYIDAEGTPLYRNDYKTLSRGMGLMQDGWYVVQGKVDAMYRVSVKGEVNLILCDGAEYTVPDGIDVPEGSSLTIWCQNGGSGRLNAGRANGTFAGIGTVSKVGKTAPAGTVTINGGTVEAHGGGGCAGIGAGWSNARLNITFIMNAGTVKAYGGAGAAGIGSGMYSEGGDVTIKGGSVYAYGGAAQNNNQGGDGIGVGTSGSNWGDITITGGSLYAEGKDGGAGIGCQGGGLGSSHIKISGGDVTAVGHGGAGIGTRRYDHSVSNDGGSVQITGGTVRALSNSYGGGNGAAVGEGYRNGSTDYSGAGLRLGDEMRVRAGTGEDSAEYAAPDERVKKTHDNKYALIEECTHGDWNYVVTPDTHTSHCRYCNKSEKPEPHSFRSGNVCTVCGAAVYTVSFSSAGGSGSMASVKVVGGNTIALPKCGFTAPKGRAFTGWDYSGASKKPAGTELTVNGNIEIRAHWDSMTWATLQTYMDNAAAGATISLDRDLTAAGSDTALTVPAEAGFTLDLNGHKLDRNLGKASSAVSGGNVLHIRKSNVTIKNGTLTGGYAADGGGVLADSYTDRSHTFKLIDVNVTGNRASRHGGGIYTGGYGRISGGVIRDNTAGQRGGGIHATNENWGLYVDGTAITGNTAGRCGGGIYAGQAVYLNDANISNNVCWGENHTYQIFPPAPRNQYYYDRSVTFEGGGVFVNESGSLEVMGATVVRDNTCTSGGTHASNVYVRDRGERYPRNTLIVMIYIDKLAPEADIGISYEISDPSPDPITVFPVQITRGLPGKGSPSNFFADKSDYMVGLNSSGELILGRTTRKVTLKPGEAEGPQRTEKVLKGSQYRLPGKPDDYTAPSGRYFAGWKDEKSGTAYREGQTIGEVTEDITLTAQWKERGWSEPVYRWADDLSSVSASRAALDDSTLEQNETSETTSAVTKEPGCTEKGETTYTASFRNPVFVTQTRTVANIDALGHDWELETAVSTGNKTTETYVCRRCSESYVITRDEEHAHMRDGIAFAAEEPATCTKAGHTAYILCTCGARFSTEQDPDNRWARPLTDEEIIIPATGHDYVTYEETARAATCTEAGREADRICSRCGDRKKGAEIPAYGHKWGSTEYVWDEDNSRVTATRVCVRDGSHVETETAEASSEITKPATCTERGELTYTSAEFENKAFAVCTKTVGIDAAGHDWRLESAESSGDEITETYRCAGCGASYDIVSAADHRHGQGTIEHSREVPASCTEDGRIFYYVCSCGARFRNEEDPEKLWTRPLTDEEIIIPALGHDYVPDTATAKAVSCTEAGREADQVCSRCGERIQGSEIPATGHDWGEWTVSEEATENEEGLETRSCRNDPAHKETRVIPKTEPGGKTDPDDEGDPDGKTDPDDEKKPQPAPGGDPEQKSTDGTDLGPGASEAAADRAVTGMTDDRDPAGTVYGRLMARSTKQGKKSVRLTWNRISGAKKYVIYGNACGSKYRMKKLASVTGGSKTVKKIAGKKLKKGRYYKFIVVALDRNNRVISASKVVHAATKGGKVGNHRRVKVSRRVLKKAKKLKTGSRLKLKAKAVKASKKAVKKHRAMRYESSDPGIASVSGKGVVKGRRKGSCYIYAYAQNGVYKRIRVVAR